MSVDSVALPFIEIALVAFAAFAAWNDFWFRRGFRPSVQRGDTSMTYFYGTFAASTTTLVALPLSLEAAAGHRIPLVFLNLAIPAYLCFVNSWFRNTLLGWVCWASEKVEE